MANIMKRNFKFAAVALLIMTMAACGKGDDKKITSQVAAKVNSDEISVHQINYALSRAGNIPPAQVKAASSQTLEKMIDQQLLVQKAIETKLDRDPQIVLALENARKQILAQAYVEKTMSAATKGTPEEVAGFYAKNPALFEQRRVYRFQELSVTGAPEKLEALKAEAQKAKSITEIAGWLKAQNMAFNANSTTKPAEQLPMELLPRLAQMKDGQIALIGGANGAAVLQLAQSQPASLNEQQAAPLIEQFLLNRKRMELVEAEVKNLREKAKIAYVGEFSAPAAKPAAAPATPVPTPAKADDVLEKGLKGMN
jgi:EpsD family peptidyl-prolyl cis-trans isomerase